MNIDTDMPRAFTRMIAAQMCKNCDGVLKVDSKVAVKGRATPVLISRRQELLWRNEENRK